MKQMYVEVSNEGMFKKVAEMIKMIRYVDCVVPVEDADEFDLQLINEAGEYGDTVSFETALKEAGLTHDDSCYFSGKQRANL